MLKTTSKEFRKKAAPIEIIPVKSERKDHEFDLATHVANCLDLNGITLQEMDVVVVSSKFAAIAERRVFKLGNLKRTLRGRAISEKYAINPGLAELVAMESDIILGGIPGFALALSNGILAPNAGIDRSNVPKGYAVPYPKNSVLTAKRIRKFLMRRMSGAGAKRRKPNLGVVLSDSRISPARLGTTGVALAAVGFEPLLDFRGKSDLFENRLKVTVKAAADQIATAAQLVMGEANESVPIAIVRGWNEGFNSPPNNLSMELPPQACLYIQGLKNPFADPKDHARITSMNKSTFWR